jgi:cytoskeletal protein CcmA (bactofilin family)
MASTYVNDLRLNEMATGDASGSWGTVTNTNLELIGEAFSYGTETIGDADSTLTIADGAADAARSFYLKITSSVDLTTTRIVTLGPNTVSKVWMIENATTGSQVITIKQGSGATINVPNGQVKMISTDGAGSGGAVLDLLVDVDLTGTTTLVNLDVSGTALVTGVLTTTAATVFNGGFASNADSTLGTDKKVQFRDAAIYINSSVDGQLDIVADTEIQIAATTVDLNGALDVSGTLGVTGVLTATSLDISGDIDVDGTTNLDVVDIDGATQIDATVTVGVDDTGYDVKFFGATTGKSLLWDESADSLIVTGTTTLVGTTNLDAVDIDGATQIDATVTVGVDDTGYDVKFFGATAGAYMLWDESADDLILGGAAGLSVNTITDASGGSTASVNGYTPQASNMQPHNLIINGAMTVAQRGTSFTSEGYTLDRWYQLLSGGTSTVTQETFALGSEVAGCSTYLKQSTSIGNDYCGLIYKVENVKSLAEGTATFSFYASGSNPSTGSYELVIYRMHDGSTVYDNPLQSTVTLTNSWQRFDYTFNVPTLAGMSTPTANSLIYIGIRQSSVDVGTSAWDLNITGVQLEAGSAASPFAHENYGDTLQKCQRYYYRIKATGINYPFGLGQCFSTTLAGALIPFPVTMRIAPSALEQSGTATDYQLYQASGSVQTCSSVPVYASILTTPATGAVNWTVTSNIVSGNVTTAGAATSSAYLAWSAEL